MYAKCYIITNGSVSANLFTLMSDAGFSLKHYLHKYYILHAKVTGFQCHNILNMLRRYTGPNLLAIS